MAHQKINISVPRIPIRLLVPNIVTLLSVGAGLTAIRFAVEENFNLAIVAIVLAAALDGLDGRIARLMKGTSRFGSELDSLADFANFGVAPALILYFWRLHDLKSAGWIVAVVFAICAGLRLARFNVSIETPNQAEWAGNFFVGVPTPAAAIVVLLPLYASFLGFSATPLTVFFYTFGIALLMVSGLHVFSGKNLGRQIPHEMMLPIVAIALVVVVVLLRYPYELLICAVLAYLTSLPFGTVAYRRYALQTASSTSPAKLATADYEGLSDAADPCDGEAQGR
jgi:CDP-diacylglycerol--serine O-phosphatidyltransferase